MEWVFVVGDFSSIRCHLERYARNHIPKMASRIAEPLQSRWGLNARDAHACAKTLLQEDIGLTCIFQLGLLSEVHLAALTKGLSHIGGTIIKLAWEDLKNARFSFFPAAGATFLNPFPNRTPDSPI